MEEQPAPLGVKTPFGSDSSKFASVNRPDRMSGLAKKMTTSGSSGASSRSHLLKTTRRAGALNAGQCLSTSLTSSGDFLWRSPLTLPGIPQERKYSKSGLRVSLKPRYFLPPRQAMDSASRQRGFPSLTGDSAPIRHLGREVCLQEDGLGRRTWRG